MSRQTITRAGGPFRNLSLGSKGILVIAIPVVALLLTIGLFYQFQEKTRAAQAQVINLYESASQVRQILIELVNAETGVRGYLITRQPEFLDRFQYARQSMPQHFAALQQFLSHDPEKLTRVAEIQSLADQKLSDLAARTAARPDPGEMVEDKASMDHLRSVIASLSTELRGELDAGTVEAHRARIRTDIAVFSGGALGLIGGLLAILLFTSRIAGRVQRVEEIARRVAQGERVEQQVAGSDEIAQLERTLQKTSQLLAEQARELRAAHVEMQERVAHRTRALQEANEQLHKVNAIRNAIISSAPLAIWSLDLEGRITFWSAGAERMFGWTEKEVIGKPLPAVPEDQREEYQGWLERFRQGEPLAGEERVRERKDGVKIDATIWTAPLRDETGRVTGTIAIDTDITDRKQLEQQFRESQKLEAVGRLAGGVAHDFNNLLTVILGYAEMLITEAQGNPTMSEYAREIQSAASRASSLTAQLLAFGRRRISQPKIIDLNEIIGQSMKMLRRIIGEDVEIATHLAAQLGKVRADPTHVDQVIINLVVNARDAMPNGGVLTIETADVTLDGTYAARHLWVKPGRYSMLAISDTGVGMSEEIRNRVFEPFFTTKEAGKGTGLGLSIVYGIVKQNNGEILVYSEPGHGTTFKVYLPSTEAAAEAEPEPARGESSRGTETVLLCEDESAIRKLVANMLSQQGYHVIEADTPALAIEEAKKYPERIDLLLTDIVMPKMNGFELAAAVHKILPETKVLYMSGYTDNRAGANWPLEKGAPFVQKPFTAALLARKVRDALANQKNNANGNSQ